DLEVAAVDRVIRPPAVDDTPLLPHDDDELAVDEPRLATQVRLDERRAGRIQPAGNAASDGVDPDCAGSLGTVHLRAEAGRVHRAILPCPSTYTSRGTTSALASGIRDQGATSTTLPTAPPPALARTCRRPSRRRASASSPSGATSASC